MQKDQDIFLSHSVLNYLHAGYQGQFVFQSILNQLAFSGFDPESINPTRSVIEKVNVWLDALWQGNALFSAGWTEPQTSESKEAFNLLEGLKPSLLEAAKSTYTILSDMNLASNPEQTKYLIATLGRYAYSRDNYVRGFIDYGQTFGKNEIAQNYSALIPQLEEDLNLVNLYLERFASGEVLEPAYYESLCRECVPLPGVFLTHIHDISQILAHYSTDFTYKMAGFSSVEASNWERQSFTAAIAGYWRAYGFEPAEAQTWIQLGITEAGAAFAWKDVRFDPVQAVPWFRLNFSPALARVWASAKFDPEDAAEQIQKGITDPAKAIP